jgi:hypothetical protein
MKQACGMRLFFLLACVALAAHAQQPQQPPRPLPEEMAFAKLSPELQRLLANVSPAEALYRVEVARQNLIALGQPQPSPEQLYATVRRLLHPSYGAVESASAGPTSFPPLSPLAAPPPPPLAR